MGSIGIEPTVFRADATAELSPNDLSLNGYTAGAGEPPETGTYGEDLPPAIFDLRPAYEASDVRRMFRLEHVRTLFIQSMRVVGIVLMVLVAADLVLFAVLARDRLTTSQFLESGLLFGFSLFLLLLARDLSQDDDRRTSSGFGSMPRDSR